MSSRIRTRACDLLDTKTFDLKHTFEVNTGSGWAYVTTGGKIATYPDAKTRDDARRDLVRRYKARTQ